MWQWGLFVAGSLVIAYLTRGSLRSRQFHGFYRFFAFEAILGVCLYNLPVWFDDPFSLIHILAWLLLTASAALAVHGFWLLRRMGQPDPGIVDPSRLGLEKTTRLVVTGAYRFIRHPLYASLLWLGLGAFLKRPDLPGVILCAIFTAALIATARVEEAENLVNFGPAYADYMRKTKRFIPFLF